MSLYEKKIAHIFKEDQVVLTVFGRFYRYEWLENHVKCRRMNRKEEQDFCRRLCGRQTAAAWKPVAKTTFNKAAVFRQLSYSK